MLVFLIYFEPVRVIKQVNKSMSVDEHSVTNWTGGQYPAAPPQGTFAVTTQRSFLLVFINKKTTACEERLFLSVEFFERVFCLFFASV